MSTTSRRLTRTPAPSGALTFALGLAAVGLIAPAPAAQATSAPSRAAAAAPARTSAAAATCRVSWGSLPKAVGLSNTAAVTPVAQLRTGHHPCYDRVVIELKGRPGKVAAAYGGSTAAGWALAVVSTTQVVPRGVPVGAYSPTGLPTVRGLVNAGSVKTTGGTGSVNALGALTRARLPFRVFLLAGPGGNSRIVLDVAHRW